MFYVFQASLQTLHLCYFSCSPQAICISTIKRDRMQNLGPKVICTQLKFQKHCECTKNMPYSWDWIFLSPDARDQLRQIGPYDNLSIKMNDSKGL